MHACHLFIDLFDSLAREFLKVDHIFLTVGIVGGACTDVEQLFIEVAKYSKRQQLLDIVKATGSLFSNPLLRCLDSSSDVT